MHGKARREPDFCWHGVGEGRLARAGDMPDNASSMVSGLDDARHGCGEGEAERRSIVWGNGAGGRAVEQASSGARRRIAGRRRRELCVLTSSLGEETRCVRLFGGRLKR